LAPHATTGVGVGVGEGVAVGAAVGVGVAVAEAVGVALAAAVGVVLPAAEGVGEAAAVGVALGPTDPPAVPRMGATEVPLFPEQPVMTVMPAKTATAKRYIARSDCMDRASTECTEGIHP